MYQNVACFQTSDFHFALWHYVVFDPPDASPLLSSFLLHSLWPIATFLRCAQPPIHPMQLIYLLCASPTVLKGYPPIHIVLQKKLAHF